MKTINLVLLAFLSLIIIENAYAQCIDPYASYDLNGNTLDGQSQQLHATNTGATLTFDRFGIPNSAYAFNGTNQQIEFPVDFDLNTITINLWFKAESSSTIPKTIFDNDHPGLINGARKIYVIDYNGLPGVNFSTGAGSTNVHSENINLNEWYMATMVVDTDVKYYLNGNLVATFPLHYSNTTAGSLFAHLGCTRLFDRYFDGDIDDVLIYDCVLSPVQIAGLFNDHKVFGMAFQDFDQNCSQSGNEAGIEGRMAIINPGNIVVETGSNGMWSIDSLPAGSYTITYDSTGNWTPTCSSVFNFTVVHPDSTTIAPFYGLISTQPCPSPNVSITMPFIRRCFTNQKIYIQASNQIGGTDVISNGYVELTLDPLLTITSSSNTYTSLGNDLYKIDLNDTQLYPGETEGITISTTVSCNAVLNQTLCVEGELFPAAACVYDTIPADDPLDFTPCSLPWDQSSISVDGWCDNDTIYFTITNTGDPIDGDMECYSPIRLYIDGDYIYLDSIMLLGGETDTLVFAGDGRTWRLEVDQHPLHPGNSHPNATVELCGSAANWTPNLVTILPQNDADPVVDIYCGLVTGSYDPNDKTGYPLGVTSDHFIAPNIKLDYLIRFQNTGTDTAFTVVVRDTLDYDLNIFSVVSGSSSHPYTLTIAGPRVLEWRFDNILLPDSTTDEPGSNGFVTFSVNQVPDLPDGTEINNNVGIYFDYNAPVITNTTSHIINRNINTAQYTNTSDISDTACFEYVMNDFVYTSSGNYYQTDGSTLYNLNLLISNPVIDALSTNDTVCNGQTTVLFGSGGANYTWTGSVSNNEPFIPQTSQMYYVSDTDEFGCVATDSIYIFVTDSLVSADFSISIGNYSVTLENTSSPANPDVVWEINNTVVSTDPILSYTFTANGTYEICLTASNSCNSDEKCITVNVTELGIEVLSESDFSIYPNPVKDQLNISLNKPNSIVNYLIIDATGRVIRNEQLSGNTIDVSGLSNGVYFLDLTIEGNSYKKKFIKN